MLVNSNSLLNEASKKGYAIGAYNINNLEWAKFILEASQEDKSPVILEITPKTVSYFGGYNVVYSLISSMINDLNITVPVSLHLDHANSFFECKRAIDAGFTSVMIDKSDSNLDANICITNEVISYAKHKNVNVEAELGSFDLENNKTNLEDAILFVTRTGVDSLAPSIGNYHGIYKEVPNLDFELLGAIAKETKIPLVLHGGSFLDDNKLKTAIFCGVCKININSELQKVWADSVRKFLNENKDTYDPRLIIKSGENAIKKKIHYYNDLFGSKSRAN